MNEHHSVEALSHIVVKINIARLQIYFSTISYPVVLPDFFILEMWSKLHDTEISKEGATL